jgi:hypothetical protein
MGLSELMRLLILLCACSSSGGGKPHSLDGFLSPVDLAGVTDLESARPSDLASAKDFSSTDLANGLDPLLSPADGSGPVCHTPGSLAECPGYAVCRFYTSTELRCDPANLSNPGIGALCNQSSDCDLMYQCYRGFCFPFCMIGSTDCGFPDDCVDVGWMNHDIGACRT